MLNSTRGNLASKERRPMHPAAHRSDGSPVSQTEAMAQLHRVLAHPLFENSGRLSGLLTYLVKQVLFRMPARSKGIRHRSRCLRPRPVLRPAARLRGAGQCHAFAGETSSVLRGRRKERSGGDRTAPRELLPSAIAARGGFGGAAACCPSRAIAALRTDITVRPLAGCGFGRPRRPRPFLSAPPC